MYQIKGNSEDNTGKEIARWYSEQVKRRVYPSYAAIGFVDTKGFIRGAVILTNYNGSNIEAHIYGPKCMTKSNLKFVFEYVFNELKCRRLTAIIEKQNKKTLRLIPRLGFVYETVLPDWYGPSPKQDGVVYRMKPENAAKWIKING